MSGIIRTMLGRRGHVEDSAHDVLAAEAFAVPAPDPRLHPPTVVIPDDPAGIAEPHDVLAAEEFPMPAPGPASQGAEVLAARAARRRRVGASAGAASFGLLLGLWRRRRH